MADGCLKLGPGKIGITSGKNKNILRTYYSHLILLWGDACLPWTESVPGLVVLQHSTELLCAHRLGVVGTSCPICCMQGLFSQCRKPAAWLFSPCFGLPACVNEHTASPVGQQVRMEQQYLLGSIWWLLWKISLDFYWILRYHKVSAWIWALILAPFPQRPQLTALFSGRGRNGAVVAFWG